MEHENLNIIIFTYGNIYDLTRFDVSELSYIAGNLTSLKVDNIFKFELSPLARR